MDPGRRSRQDRGVDETALVAKLDEVAERYVATGGQSGAAAAEIYQGRLREWRAREGDEESCFTVPEGVVQRVFVGLCQRYGLTPYRRPRQKRSTLCVRAPQGFVDALFWPQFAALAKLVDFTVVSSVERVVQAWSGRPISDRFGSIPGIDDARIKLP
jgi:hypothetical protein